MSEEEKREQLEFAKKLLDTSEGFYVQVGKPTFIMLIDIIAEQQKEIELVTKSYDKALDMLVDKDNKIKEKIKELENKEFLYKEEKRFNEEEIKFNYAKRILQGILGEENERRRK